MGFFTLDELAFAFGLLGNIVSFLVFLSPVPTFYTIYKKKTSQGFQSLPYVVALSSSTLLLYYGFLKTNAYLIISINIIGCVVEATYLTLYMIYAPRNEKIFTLKLILFFNIGAYGAMMILINAFVHEPKRVAAVGWICAVFSIGVFAAPLSIMRLVIRTKSVEYMPFSLSFFLTLCATVWFLYGLFVKDFYIAVPNAVGFLLGIFQMALYMLYKDANKDVETKAKQQKENEDIKLSSIEIGPAESNQNNI